MNDQKIKNILKIIISSLIYYSGLFFLLNKTIKRNGLVVFNYHNFNTFTNDYWENGELFETNYQKNFERQIKFIKEHIGFVQPESIAEQLEKNDLKALITFDDGYKDNFDIAFPILKKYNIPAIFIISTGFIDNNKLLWHDRIKQWGIENCYSKKKIKRILKKLNADKINIPQYIENIDIKNRCVRSLMMNWNTIKEIATNGYIVGAHTQSHIPLNYLDELNEFKEIRDSMNILKINLSQDVEFFAVPNGKYSANTQNILKELHIRYCFSIIPGINDNRVNRYFLKRNALLPSDPISVVALKILVIKLLK